MKRKTQRQIDEANHIEYMKWAAMTDTEKRDALLPTELAALESDKDMYLDCMNNKLLKDRHSAQEIRDGLILFGMVYRHIRPTVSGNLI